MQHKFFIQAHLHRKNVKHGGIGNIDIETILLREGYTAIDFPGQFDFSTSAKIKRAYFLLSLVKNLPRNSQIVFQAPLYAQMHYLLIFLLQKFRSDINLICFIADIDGIRDGKSDLLQKEKRFFKRIRNFIVHNEAMKSWLHQFHPEAKVGTIEAFDMLFPIPGLYFGKENSVCYAGNLYKSSFIKELPSIPEIEFHIYGEGDKVEGSNIIFYGELPPYLLTQKLEGSFGLVWDGESSRDLVGSFGKYLEVNSPSKASLFILAGRPLIVHSRSALAPLVKSKGIGILCDDLQQLPELLKNVTQEDLNRMKANLEALASTISQGQRLPAALAQLEKEH